VKIPNSPAAVSSISESESRYSGNATVNCWREGCAPRRNESEDLQRRVKKTGGSRI